MSTAQIETPDLGVVAQRSARPFRADPPHGQNIRPLTQRERLARVLLNEQDAEPARVDLANAVEHEALERGRTSPASVCSSVDFPAPFGPMTATSSPSSTRSERPCRMSLSP